MADIDSRLIDLTPETLSSASSPSKNNRSEAALHHQRSPSNSKIDVQTKRQQRHSKKLSINFPILVPARGNETPDSQYTASPVSLPTQTMMHASFFSPTSLHTSHASAPSSVILPMPLTPPSERSEDDPLQTAAPVRSTSRNIQAKGHTRKESTSSEFLTLLASQERRVLELKEELVRAETELITLKKQWAMHEANKKKDEIKGAPAKMGPVVSSHIRAASVVGAGAGLGLSGLMEPASDGKTEAEREKRREIARERMMGRWTSLENGQHSNANVKKSNQRIFSNSRHTRTLSLLTTSASTKDGHNDMFDTPTESKMSLEWNRRTSGDVSGTPATVVTSSMPSLSRTNSGLEGLNLGKTYKDLASAATRKNLPTGLSPEQFVKQGKQMVDGVRDGLWTFFEDIRQATVGEEAINGPANTLQRRSSTRNQGGSNHSKLKRTSTNGSSKSNGSAKDDTKDDRDSSFWKEFGMDTPKSDRLKKNGSPEKRPSLPGRWPSTKVGDDFTTVDNITPVNDSATACCPKHGHGRRERNKSKVKQQDGTSSLIEAQLDHDISSSTKDPDIFEQQQQQQHHESKSSTDSRHPPSLLSDLLDDEDEQEEESWDNWESHTDPDPGSPDSVRRKKTIDADNQRNRDAGRFEGEVKEVHWHDLMA